MDNSSDLDYCGCPRRLTLQTAGRKSPTAFAALAQLAPRGGSPAATSIADKVIARINRRRPMISTLSTGPSNLCNAIQELGLITNLEARALNPSGQTSNVWYNCTRRDPLDTSPHRGQIVSCDMLHRSPCRRQASLLRRANNNFFDWIHHRTFDKDSPASV
jgi:hypothetical protein